MWRQGRGGHPGGSIEEFDGGRGQGKREEGSGIERINGKQFIPFGPCFMFQGQRAGSISQECREKECFMVGQKEKVYQDWGWVG